MVLSCSFCKKVFRKQSNLEQHERIHTNERPFACPVCGLTFVQKSNMKKHAGGHGYFPGGISSLNSSEIDETNLQLVRKTYNCQFCSQTFSSYLTLRKHLSTHKQNKVYKCMETDCGVEFSTVQLLLAHAAHHQTATSTIRRKSKNFRWWKVKCEKCCRVFRTLESLRRHYSLESHSHPCPICNRICTSERCLRKHLLEHTTLECPHCRKVFRTQKGLREHTRLHNSTASYVCDLCGRTFCALYRLRRHIGIHFHRDFVCPYRDKYGCEKTFYRKDKLKNHVKSHEHKGTTHGDGVTNLEIISTSDANLKPPPDAPHASINFVSGENPLRDFSIVFPINLKSPDTN